MLGGLVTLAFTFVILVLAMTDIAADVYSIDPFTWPRLDVISIWLTIGSFAIFNDHTTPRLAVYSLVSVFLSGINYVSSIAARKNEVRLGEASLIICVLTSVINIIMFFVIAGIPYADLVYARTLSSGPVTPEEMELVDMDVFCETPVKPPSDGNVRKRQQKKKTTGIFG